MTLTYLLPLRREVAERAGGDLAVYLRQLTQWLDVVVVDGSAPTVREAHMEAFGPKVTLIAPAAQDRCANGKAWGVLTGLRQVRTDGVVVADDDVRWRVAALQQVAALLDAVDLVIPQNYFNPLTWHAAWDSGRMLLNRATSHDWPGTLALRVTAAPGAPAYDGNVLFENCELVRTVRAHRGRVRVAHDLLIARRPPSFRHFLAQRPRQAYDDFAQPLRMAVMLVAIPFAALAGARATAVAAVASVAVAEVGRRRCGGRLVFPWYTSLCAPAWLSERAVLAWWALWLRSTGRGARYGGTRFVVAATSQRALNRRVARALAIPSTRPPR